MKTKKSINCRYFRYKPGLSWSEKEVTKKQGGKTRMNYVQQDWSCEVITVYTPILLSSVLRGSRSNTVAASPPGPRSWFLALLLDSILEREARILGEMAESMAETRKRKSEASHSTRK